MTKRLDRVIRAVCAVPWAILPEKLDAITELLELKANGETFSTEEIRARIGSREATRSQTQGSIAVLPLFGVVAHRMNMMTEISGGTSTEQFGQWFDAAVQDPNVSAIVLDIDSPGGSVEGVEELAAKIYAARGTKPIIAHANSLAASAAYWIASAADQITVTPSGLVGSIGVFTVHTDLSEMAAKEGVKHTVIRAGKYKAEDLSLAPLTDEALAAKQAEVDEVYGAFVKAVAKHRDVTVAEVRGGYGEGRALRARTALAAGMVDKVATLDQVLASLGVGKTTGKTKALAAALPLAAASTLAPILALTGDTAPNTMQAGEPRVVPIAAPKAKEKAMSEVDAAAHTGAEPEETREEKLSKLATLHNMHDKLSGWIVGKLEPDSPLVQAQIREHYHAAAVTTVEPKLIGHVGLPNESKKPWKSGGEFYGAVMNAYSPGGSVDPRLFAAASGMNQAIPSEGGFTVAPEFSQTIWDGLNADPNSLLGMTDNYTVTGESLTFNANAETSRATGSRFGGVRGYWINEADQITKSKPTFRQAKVEPQQLAVLVYLTEKLMRNSGVALEQYVNRAAGEEINFLVGDAIVNGTGVGQPKGITTSSCLITVNKETSQAAATIQQENIAKMWARMHPRSRANAIWLHNVDIEPQLDFLSTVVKNVAQTENVGGYANKVFDAERRTLKGRPLIASEFAATLGTAGDLILADMRGYLSGTRGGVESAMSMHVRFEYAEQAFRFIFEVDGQPWLAAPQTPYKGTNTLSTFVNLQTRS